MSGAKQHAPPPRTHQTSAIGESEDVAQEADRGNSFAQGALQAGPDSQSAAGGMFGWFKKAGSWVADNYHKAADAVGDFVHRTGEAAKDLYEVWSSSDVSMKDGKISLSTDMDEVMDLLPESARKALSLDRDAGSENKVQLELDTHTKALTIRAPDLRIAGMQHDKLRSGAASLQGVVITITNPNGGLPGLDGSFSMLGYNDKDDNLGVDISVARVLASNVELPDGSLRAKELELGAFRANASARGGLPFGEKGSTVASFSVGNAVLRGLEAPGTTADSVTGKDLAGGLDQGAETAYLEAGELSARRLSNEGRGLGSGSIRDLRADIRNSGGGMPFLDEKQDHLQSTVSAGEAKVLDATDSGLGSLQSGAVKGLRATHNADTGAIGVQAAALDASGLDTQAVDLNTVSAQDLSASFDHDATHSAAQLTVGQGQLGGLDTAQADAKSGRFAGLRARFDQDSAGMSGSGAVDKLAVEGLDTATVDARSADVTGVTASFGRKDGKDSGSASAQQLRVSGLDTDGVDAQSLVATGLRAEGSRQGDTLTGKAGVGSLSVAGLDTAAVDAKQLDVSGANASFARNNGTDSGSASLDRVAVAGLDTAEADAQTVVATGLRAEGSRQGDTLTGKAGVGNLSVAGLDTAAVDAKQVDLAGVNAELSRDARGSSGSASVDTLSVAALDTAQLDAETLTASNLRASRNNDTTTGSIGSADATGLSAEGLAVQRAHLDRANATLGPDSVQAQVGNASLQGAKLDTASVDATLQSASVQDARYSQQGEHSSADAKRVAATGLGFQVDPSTGKSTEPSGLDAAQLTRTLAARVDDADVSATVPMKPGEYKTGVGLGVERGTQLDASLQVRDNQIVGSGTKVGFNHPIDAPLWTNLRGAYVDKDGHLKADVGGWFDQDVGKSVNEGLGVPGKSLASVGTYGDAVADKMEAPAGPAPAKKDGKPGLQDAFALDQANARARVSLSAGTVDAGNAKVELADAPGANTFNVQSRGGDALVLSFAQLLTRSLNLTAGGQSIQTGGATVGDASLSLDQGGADKGTVRGSIGNITVEDLRQRR